MGPRMIMLPSESPSQFTCKYNIVISWLSSFTIYIPLLPTVRTVFSHKKYVVYLHKIIFYEGHLAMAPSDNLTCEK